MIRPRCIDFVVFEGSCGGPNDGKRFLQHPSDGVSTFCYGRTLTKREPGFDISGIPTALPKPKRNPLAGRKSDTWAIFRCPRWGVETLIGHPPSRLLSCFEFQCGSPARAGARSHAVPTASLEQRPPWRQGARIPHMERL